MNGLRTITNSPMLPVFLRWWQARLSECLPARLRAKQVETLLDVSPDGTLALTSLELQALPRPKHKTFLHSTPHTVLCLPPGSILKRRITLPEAARTDPTRATHYELDRLTPFQPDDIVWSLDTTPHPAPPGFIAFDLLIAPRKTFNPAQEQLSLYARAPTHLRAPSRHTSPPLTLPLSHAPSVKRPRHTIFLLLICLLLVSPFILQQVQLFRINSALSTLENGRNHAETLQHQIMLTQLGPLAVRKEEQRNGLPLITLQNLTDALPDDTYLTSLRLRGRQIFLEGQSKEAARLIVTLRQAGHFSDVAFSGPVLRSDNHQADLFALTATTTNAFGQP
ncbi:PilN domain-containing protein [Neokomagataea thailandica]|uniref:PilN domain-containing protein n=1 Tax=Neokomagataea TaxID=1223423 RepID=UPI000830DEE2|nr:MULTISPECIES: PilN domain-containing protein [Neokomagataea]